MPDLSANSKTIPPTAVTGERAPTQINEAETGIEGPVTVAATVPRVAGFDFTTGVITEVSAGHSPDDKTSAPEHPGFLPVPPDTAGGDAPRGKPSFDTDNDEAVPVFQRSAESFTSGFRQVATIVQIIGRQPGRQKTTLAVPETDMFGNAVDGVMWSYTDSDLAAATAAGTAGGATPAFLLPGMSVSIEAEAPVWVAPIPGNSVGSVMFLSLDNPSGGQLGGL